MYKLVYFKATNFSGFVSGLGKKTFELNLSSLESHDIVIIAGDNATGKSTFLSFVHPWHNPTDKRSHFVLEGKEGTLIREYKGDDGTSIITRCVYAPKGDSHTAKCYFKIIRGEGEETELNPNGNVASYYSLVYTYFGINKDYVNFASYTEAVTNIVKMTDTERKLNVTSLIPNTKRFELAYDTINNKYKELRNIMRNVTQKILSLSDEDTLRGSLKRIEKDINRFTSEREDLIKKTSKLEGHMKGMTNGKDIEELRRENNQNYATYSKVISDARSIEKSLRACYKKLHIKTINDNSVDFIGSNNVSEKVREFDRKADKAEFNLVQYKARTNSIRESLNEIENELMNNESILYSLQSQDVDELKRVLNGYRYRIENMEYAKHQDDYKNMNYDEAVRFINILDMISRMVQSIYEEYGQLFSEYYENPDNFNMQDLVDKSYTDDMALKAYERQLENIRYSIMEKEQYRKLQTILDQRPTGCVDDSCPFIAHALKWEAISSELETLYRERDTVTEQKIQYENIIKSSNDRINLIRSVQPLNDTLNQYADQFNKYLNVSVDAVKKGIKSGNYESIFDISLVKRIAAVLSEKDLYHDIINIKIPDIEHHLELAKTSESSKRIVENTCVRLRDSRDAMHNELDELAIHTITSSSMLDKYRNRRDVWKQIEDDLNEYRNLVDLEDEINKATDELSKKLDKLFEIEQEVEENKKIIKELANRVEELFPQREQLKFNLLTLDQLKLEKAVIETDFMIVDVMRSIIQPGKGLWKEAINIYMYDIRTIANQLLLNTFDGNLYLNDFVINDKSFIIPFTYSGNEGKDISVASSGQQSTICTALSLAIISKLIDRYGILTYDEVDAPLSPGNKALFVDILTSQMRYIGIRQAFIITHGVQYYEPYNVGYIAFPGADITSKNSDCIVVK